MAQQQWFFCLTCYKDQIFQHIYKSHGMFSGGHTDWHCSVCNDCRYDVARQSH
jgi:hypothetical protein